MLGGCFSHYSYRLGLSRQPAMSATGALETKKNTIMADIDPETVLPENRLSPELHHSKALQHAQPQPSKLVCTSSQAPPPVAAPTPTPQAEVEAVAELIQILTDCMGELRTKSRELLLMKFFSEIEKEPSLESFIIQRLKQSKVGLISELLEKLPERSAGGQGNSEEMNTDSISTRGLDESVEELTQKLERFKVKTLDLGEVVEEENKLHRFKVRFPDLGGDPPDHEENN
ncbi:hypothetical protein F0562_016087 [Nyssa sinensis]|uniref:Uncharacterized protein n=1 Tax=Nyssa sinensis TaxID=561372 RepID=A0A5J4ZIL3_9ASTE|nr:hypothetical protein F0562_016087 [Nyssa sinensis]